MSTNANSNDYTIIATGVFAAGGIDYGGNKIDLAVFADGAFSINHTAINVGIENQPEDVRGQGLPDRAVHAVPWIRGLRRDPWKRDRHREHRGDLWPHREKVLVTSAI